MVSAQTQTGLILRHVGQKRILPFVQIAFDRGTTAATETPEHIARDGGFLFIDNGKPCAGFTVRDNGSELFITAAGATTNEHDITKIITRILPTLAQRKTIAFQTGRAGLIRKAKRLGYRQVGTVKNGVIMQKVIDASHN